MPHRLACLVILAALSSVALWAEEGGGEAPAESNYVIIDNVQYTWEEAIRKFPEMRSSAPKSVLERIERGEAAPPPPAEKMAEPMPVIETEPKAVEEPMPAPKVEPPPPPPPPVVMEAPKPERKRKKGEPLQPLLQPVAEPTPEHAEQIAIEKARARLAKEEDIRKQIFRLTTSGWRLAQQELLAHGKDAVPLLIEALSHPLDAEGGDVYPLDTYNRAAANRPTRTRPLTDMAFETLDSFIRNHSDWKGRVPSRDADAWREFWSAHGGEITLGKM